MLKKTLYAMFFASVFQTHAADWEANFFSSIHNELPPVKGVVVDDLGYTHAQAFNRQVGSSSYDFMHGYTLNAQGQTPWIWSLRPADRMSVCGVYANAGQRLDCSVRQEGRGNVTNLVMSSSTSSQTVWQTNLEFPTLLDASIPTPNQALVVSNYVFNGNTSIVVTRIDVNGMQSLRIIQTPCANDMTWYESKFRMPKTPTGTIRQVEVCGNANAKRVTLKEFDDTARQWNTLSTLDLSHETQILHTVMNEQGRAFLLTRGAGDTSGIIETDASGQMRFGQIPTIGYAPYFVANNEVLAIVSYDVAGKNESPNIISWYSLTGPFFFQGIRSVAELSSSNFRGVALSSENQLIVNHIPRYRRERPEFLTVINQTFNVREYMLPFNRQDEVLGKKTYVLSGPNNVVILARNIQNASGIVGVRVNQVQLSPF